MDSILVVNAGSSSVKFQVFGVDDDGKLARKIKGQMDGIGTRPRLRASRPERKSLVDREYDAATVPDVPAALHTAGAMAAGRAAPGAKRGRPPRRAWRP